MNRKDLDGANVFQGGFLGLDNIGLFDRDAALPGGVHLGQADGTAWMGMFCLNMLGIALELAQEGATIILCGRNSESLEKTKQEIENQANTKLLAIAGDLSVPAEREQIIKGALQALISKLQDSNAHHQTHTTPVYIQTPPSAAQALRCSAQALRHRPRAALLAAIRQILRERSCPWSLP